ncbi:B12-binding domain-containing radical SAM protein [Streptomyces sp. NPDC059193]|uniref:B12-binding domain-containing radical SAM protein n=1 Tax=Streptomyces sp. NPDC059193 TaxID=3346763 RepID=UPI0036CB29AC
MSTTVTVNAAKRRIYVSAFSRSAYLPAVWGALRSYADTQPDLVEAYTFEQPFFLPEQAKDPVSLMEDPAVFAMSCYLWNFNKNMAACRAVKERFPDAVTVVGGPHVPDNATEFLAKHPYIDFAIHKEGEAPFSELLRALLHDEPDFASVPSLSYRDQDGKVRRNPLGGQLPREIDVPSPWLTGLMEPSFEAARAAGYQPTVLWETNRGCPYSCTFCDWGSANQSKIRKFDEDRLHAEIDYFTEQNVSAILCADANFGILPRDVGLAEHLVRNKQESGYPGKFVTSYAKNANDRIVQISSMFALNGMSNGTILAMQSGTQDVLEQVKRSNMPAKNYEKLAAAFRERGVEAYTEVIVGLPNETPETFARGLCRMLEMGIHDDIMIYECVLLPNAEMGSAAHREKYELDTITRTYLPDDVEEVEVVVGHSTMSRADWVRMYLFGAVLQALHNRGITRQLATYLHTEGILGYEDFYRSLADAALADTSTVLGEAVDRARALLWEYIESPTVPNEGKVASQPDMMERLARWVPDKESWLIYEWCWAYVQNELDRFYGELRGQLEGAGVKIDERLEELLRYQRASVFTVAESGTSRVELFSHDWTGYFRSPADGLHPGVHVTSFEPPAGRMR